MKSQWQIEPDAAAVADAACRMISAAARAAIEMHGEFRLVLAGGSTPLAAYRRLADSDQRWQSWSLFYGDERCLPADDQERNSRMVSDTGLAKRVGAHLPIPAELGAKDGAAAYREQIKDQMPFDLVLLGMGEDGHTASLFPGHTWPKKSVFAVCDAPKPPPDRISMSPETLQNCRQMLVLVTGAGKASTVGRWRDGEALPVARVSDLPQATILTERDCLPVASGQSNPSAE